MHFREMFVCVLLALVFCGCTITHYENPTTDIWIGITGVGTVDIPLQPTPSATPNPCEVLHAESKGFSVGFTHFLEQAAIVVGAWFGMGGS